MLMRVREQESHPRRRHLPCIRNMTLYLGQSTCGMCCSANGNEQPVLRMVRAILLTRQSRMRRIRNRDSRNNSKLSRERPCEGA